MRALPPPRNFRSGELAPWLDGISNETTQSGCRTLENWIVLKQGAARRRPGTYYAGEVKDSNDATILVPVEIDTDNIYVLEIGDLYIRFWNQSTHAVVGAPYEVTSPWSTGELSDLRWQYIPNEQSVYWVHPKHAMRKLAFTSTASWSMTRSRLITTPPLAIAGTDSYIEIAKNHVDFTLGTLVETDTSSNVEAIVDTGYGLYVGGNALLQVTEDSGLSWIDILPATGAYITALGKGRGRQVMAGTMSGKLYISNDGVTWDERTSGTSGILRVMGHMDSTYDQYWLAGEGVVGYSYDGYTWTTSVLTSTIHLVDASFARNRSADNIGGVAYVAVFVGHDGTNGVLYRGVTKTATFTGFQYVYIAYGEPDETPLWVGFAHDGGASGTMFTMNANGAITRYPWSGTTYATMLGNSLTSNIYWIQDRFWGAHRRTSALTIAEYVQSFDGITWERQPATFHDGSSTYGASPVVITEPLFDDDPVALNSSTSTYPHGIMYHEGRLICGPTTSRPGTLYGSAVREYLLFYAGELASDAWSYDITSERNVDIQWIMGGNQLVVGTRTGEGMLVGSQDEGITPSAARFLWLSTFGSKDVQPVRIHDTIVFVQRGGEIIRGLVPGAGNQAWQSPDLTYNSDHIADGGVTQLAHQDDPQTILYAVRSGGQLLALTFHPPNTIAWSRILTDGVIESVAVVPTSGAEDEVWAIVNRTIGAATKRYVEYFDTLAVASKADAHYVDCGRESTNSVAFATMGSLTHLAGEVVDVLIDGNEVLTGLTVAASGTIAFTAGYSGTHCHAGLPFISKLQTMRMDYGSPWGTGAGLNKRTSDLLLWVHDSLGGLVGPTYTLAEESVIAVTSTAELTTDVVRVNFPGEWDRDGYLWIVQTKPLPFTVVGMVPNVQTGEH